MKAAIIDWLVMAIAAWMVYLRWRFGPFTAHALWLYRWNRRRLMARMRREARARRRTYPDPYGIYDNLPPDPGARRHVNASRDQWTTTCDWTAV